MKYKDITFNDKAYHEGRILTDCHEVRFRKDIQDKIDKLVSDLEKDNDSEEKIEYLEAVGNIIYVNPVIYISGTFNKFDWIYQKSLNVMFHKIGLGEKIYIAAALNFGILSSNRSEARNSATKVWRKLLVNPLFYVIKNKDNTYIFDKNNNKNYNKIMSIVESSINKDLKIFPPLGDYLLSKDKENEKYMKYVTNHA